MAAEKRWRLVCYDVRDAKRWRKVYKLVRGTGQRVQYSVFRCRLDNQQIERLRWELAQVMADEDSLLVVDLCPSCASNVISRNHVEGWTTKPATFQVWPPQPIHGLAKVRGSEEVPRSNRLQSRRKREK